jgi:hypothetical protein
MAIFQENRVETAVKVQDILTKYGCYIRVRLGLHGDVVDGCSNNGMILLQLTGEEVVISELEQQLQAIPKIRVKYMILDF